MAGKIVLVFAILVAISTSWIEAAPPGDYDFYDFDTNDDPIICGSNEDYTRSGGVSQPTCQDLELSISIRIGMPGCVCKEGYVRGPEWVCIKKEDCFFVKPYR